MLRDSNIIKNHWGRARIVKIFPNADGFVRCIELIKPDRSTCLRDILNLGKLECDVYE